MDLKNGMLLIAVIISCSACLEKQHETNESNLNSEEVLKRQLKVYEDAEASPQQFKDALKESCPHYGNALLTTAETIQLGTRVFNAGGVSLTKRIYEGTIYKLLFTIKDDCMSLSDALQVGLAKAYETEDHHDQAWAMRNVLDLIMGGPPSRPPGAQ
ncbi:MAG: hypothetical protein GKR92_11220 [Gammaproteobacteria bacterium]|nr:MAG: hypothetical protein GKR92_11220 [Gammaproteobacteria bacterium]